MSDNVLRHMRQTKQTPLLQLAVQAGVSTTTLVAVERYGYLPKLETRQRIANALGVSEEDIWPREQRLSQGEEVRDVEPQGT